MPPGDAPCRRSASAHVLASRATAGQSARVAANGPGDDPIIDIVMYRLPVFSPAVDVLIAEIVALGGRREIEERYGAFYWGSPSFKHELDSLRPMRPMRPTVEDELLAIRGRLEREGRAGGWEVDRLLDEARRGRGNTEQP